MREQFHIDGMHCGSCESKVATALLEVPGVDDVEVFLDRELAVIEADESVTTEKLEEHLHRVGDYHIQSLEALPQSDEAIGLANPHGTGHPQVKHNTSDHTFVFTREGRESTLSYSLPTGSRIVLEHTFVPPADRNRGIAEKLTRRALAYAEDNGLTVTPECAYVRSFIADHPEFQSLVESKTKRKKKQHASSHDHAHGEKPEASRSTLATYWPLLLTVLYLLGGTALAATVASNWTAMFAMSTFMGLFFVAFSFFKLLDIAGFAQAYSSYDIVAGKWMGWGYVYPFVELALGIAYLLGVAPIATTAVTLLVMIVGTVGVVNAVVRGRDIQCGCLGTMFDLPMSTVTIVEDVSMAAMAAAMLALLI